MGWPVINREKPMVAADAKPLLTEEVKARIMAFFPRYETKRAALIPALHVIQNTYGQISPQAMKEVAELLGLVPGEVWDTMSFYTHFWTHHRGKKVIVVCRSLTCQVMGSERLVDVLKRHLKIDEHQTTPDGEWSLMTEECLGACEHGPCMLINERLHSRVKAEEVAKILADPNCDKVDLPAMPKVQPQGPMQC
ncbi:MAG TPA: NAD(P)H-dependent oxidoreductase subunit E [Tepidisphaeraceae bacterium]|nr:NAD(P)H-dependent oxidoreductase subunit E [Tepidisphaeraceae bacterium]